MSVYKRESNSGHVVEWDPEDDEKAAEAMVECSDTRCMTVSEVESGEPEKVDRETAQRVRSLYRDKVGEN